MKTFELLYIEHSRKRVFFKRSMEQAGFSVDLIPELDIKAIENQLSRKFYHLIVTDAFFLPKDVEHDSPEIGSDDFYGLGEILELVNRLQSHAKIVVHTYFNQQLFQHYQLDLNRVNLIIDKSCTNPSLFEWQIKRFKEDEVLSRYQNHALISTLLKLLASRDDLIWKEQIASMLSNYRLGINSNEQFESIQSDFLIISSEMEIAEKFNLLIKHIYDTEPFIVATNPQKWGHLRHVLNVFWLGYYFLNSGLIDLTRVASSEILEISKKSNKEPLVIINEIWLLASLFHDVGHFGQELRNLTEKVNEAVSVYPMNVKQLQVSTNSLAIMHYNNHAKLRGKVCDSDDILNEEFESIFESKKIDHGMLSAITVYDIFDSLVDPNLLKYALKPIAFHNIFQGDGKYPKDLTFGKAPFLCLLILCDILEMWDRETGHESIYKLIPLEKIELVELIKENDCLRMSVNYKLRIDNLSTDFQADRYKKKIIEILTTKTLEILQRMHDDLMPKLSIEFKLNYFLPILTWESNNE